MKPLFYLVVFLLIANIQGHAGIVVDKIQAKNIIIRTNRVIGHAQMSVKRGKNYSGDLAKSVIHARIAKKLFIEGNYIRAIHHSRLARILANQAIKANKVKLPMDSVFTATELQLFGETPPDSDLTKEAEMAQPDALKDEDLMDGNLLIDFVEG